ncbi:MAG: DUF1846 family protein [Kiritimatiellae bacterium]|nr:DUF1846 family protein [Kiritimatiellia bacterium]
MISAFDNDKYIALQSEAIRERAARFGNKLYLEIGGKLLQDLHASRVLPGFEPDVKLRMLQSLGNQLEFIVCAFAGDIEHQKLRADFGTTYDAEVLRLVDDIRARGLAVRSVVLTRFDPAMRAAAAFADRLRREGLSVYLHSAIPGYPADVDLILSDEGFGRNPMVETSAPIVGVVAPGPGSGKLATALSQVWHENRRGVGAGYAKYETFPVWNVPLSHPLNVAYEAATADIEDFNQIDPFELEATGATAVNYNRDVAAFPVLRALLSRLLPPDQVYRSPTDMGVNKVGFAIADDQAVQEASRQEIIRRHLKGQAYLALGRATTEEAERLRAIMARTGLKETDRAVVAPAREAAAAGEAEGRGFGGSCCAAAIALPDGSIVTGRNSRLLRSGSAAILNAVKKLAGIPDSLDLLPAAVVRSVTEMKAGLLGRRSSNLNVEELLIALAISANMNSVAALALEKLPALHGCEMHMTHLTSASDAEGLRRLGLRVTNDPRFPAKPQRLQSRQ